MEKVQANQSNGDQALHEPLHPEWEEGSRGQVNGDTTNFRKEIERARWGAEEILGAHQL